MMKGKAHLEKMCPSKREMYEEIYSRVMVMYTDYPDKTISELCSMVVMQPAPNSTSRLVVQRLWFVKQGKNG